MTGEKSPTKKYWVYLKIKYESKIKLANFLGVSYNTLTCWIRRGYCSQGERITKIEVVQ